MFKKDGWIQTYSGKLFYPLQPDFTQINIIDIAHSLSLICRYVGHCKHFYSVAQHSVIVADYFKDDIILAKWGLLHDGPEAFIVDIPRPIKHYLIEYCELEDQYNKLFAKKFNLPYPIPPEVNEIDTRLLVTERHNLMKYGHEKLLLHNFEEIERLDINIPKLLPEEAELRFLQKYIELFEI